VSAADAPIADRASGGTPRSTRRPFVGSVGLRRVAARRFEGPGLTVARGTAGAGSRDAWLLRRPRASGPPTTSMVSFTTAFSAKTSNVISMRPIRTGQEEHVARDRGIDE
jgi:hypothetical protein